MQGKRLKPSQSYKLVDPVHDNVLVVSVTPESFGHNFRYDGTAKGRNMCRGAGHVEETSLLD
jgi:hypothetical protein